MYRLFTIICLTTLFFLSLFADAYSDYIERYAPIAVEQQQLYGIPASITLSQGLLESAAGRSRLALNGNNHFGIKCHNEWTGDTLLRSDDAPNECFRAYNSARESFEDHSKFLLRKRYAPLFQLAPTDYAGWAATLSRCGYATDPNYADRLVTIIERYALYTYDTEAGRRSEETSAFIHSMLMSTHKVRRGRGLHYVIAMPGDTYATIAKEFNLDKKKLLKYNDALIDGEIKPWEEVYLEPKLTTAPEGIDEVTIGEDETIHSVAQRFGMTVAAIRTLNRTATDAPGTRLRLRKRIEN